MIVNEPAVVFQDFGDEVVLINLERGHYYSLRGTAWEVFACLRAGLSPAAVLPERYRGEAEAVRASVEAFLEELRREGLVRDGTAPSPGPPELPPLPPGTGFAAPEVERYTDLEDLLLLDPIHDVDETGWPRPRPD